MSTASYSQISDEEESVTFAPVEDEVDISENMSTRSTNTTSSLLERIQKQKMMQQSTSSPSPRFHAAIPLPSSEEERNILDESEFEDSHYSYAGNGGQNMNIPDYSSANARNNFGNVHYGDVSSDIQGGILHAFSVVGNAAGSIASGVFQGTKHLVTRAMKHGSDSIRGDVGMNRMDEMDYQRESLLMDPHDYEDTSSFGAGRSQPVGLRGYDDSMSHSRGGMMSYIKQFCIDIKDLFLASSRNVQIGTIIFFVFLIWLLVSEEEKWFG